MIETNFRHTEIGPIPHDWEVKTLGEHASIFRGGSPRPIEAFITNSVDGINWLKIGDVAPTDKYFTKCVEKILPSGVAHSRRVFAGDFILSNSMSFGRPYILKIDGCIHDGWLVIQDYATSFNMEYLYYVLSSDFVKYQYISMAAGSSVQNLNKDKVACVQIITPPTLTEQERIAGALSSIDTLIGALNEQIEKKRHIKQGTMQQLLTGKKRLAGFTGEWKSVKLGELCQLFGRIGFRGYTKNDLVEKGMGAITFSPSDIHNQKIDYSNCDYISFHKYEESPEIKVFNGDIIFGKTASIGKCAIIDKLEEKATINPQFVVLKKFKCNNYFLYYKLIDKPFQTQVLAICGGSTIPTMSQEKLKEQELWFPPTIAEQSAIAAVLSMMDTEIAALEQKRDKYIAIKSGMMQDLLTGKIRLV